MFPKYENYSNIKAANVYNNLVNPCKRFIHYTPIKYYKTFKQFKISIFQPAVTSK